MTTLTLAQANIILAKALEASRAAGYKPMAIVVLDEGGHLKASQREDGAWGDESWAPVLGTVLGWEVDDIHAAIRELMPRGVHFEQFNLPFMKQDEMGVWTPPNGDKVAWFKDPDGNVLSISQHNHEA